MLQKPADDGVASFVVSHDALFARADNLIFLLQAPDYAVNGVGEVLVGDELLIAAGSNERSLVADVGNFGTRKARRLGRQLLGVYVGAQRERLEMHVENLGAAVDVRLVNANLAVEATGTQQGRVEGIGPVGSGQDDNARVSAEAIHFHQ